MRHVLALSLALAAQSPHAQQVCSEDAMLVFDGSGSMAEMGFNDIDEPRIFEARRAVRRILPELAVQRRLGLVVYGPGGADECSGLDLRFSPMPNAAQQIIYDIDTLQPAGDTALTAAVALAARVLRAREKPGTIVVVTDGKETCGGAPCALAADLAALAHQVTVHVIGFKVRGDRFSWEADSDYRQSISVAQCLADRTGGHYVSTETVEDLIAALEKTLGCKYLF